METVKKTRLATMWLSGCSGCHMSFLDLDEALIDLAGKVQIVYGPMVDVKEFPENVDIALIEGAVGDEEQLSLLKKARERSKILISFGDCAVSGNVPALRNAFEDSDNLVLQRAYVENVDLSPQIPKYVPQLLKKVYTLHEIVKIDYYIPGCPPSANVIGYVLNELLSGRTPNMEGRSHYG
jgi:NAD-reducing hydrogenase small subunit